MRKLLSLVLATVLCLGLVTTGTAQTVSELPRHETMYFGGMQWSPINTWNPIGTRPNNGMAIQYLTMGAPSIMFETLYMFNILDGSLVPLLADGDYQWNDTMTELSVKLKAAAKWSDGTPITSEDVKKTFDIGVKTGNSLGVAYDAYIAEIKVVDDKNFIVAAKTTKDGKPVNPIILLDYLVGTYVAQKAWIEKVEARCASTTEILNDKAMDVVWSGPYTRYFDDTQKVVYIRDDNYWGQDPSMWGKLPVPKYLSHAFYANNAASETAFKAGEIDVNQQFIPNVQDLWLKDGLPISTYMSQPPYGICLQMPTAYYNMNIPALKDNVALRKAIAIAVDYDAIIANAMTNQSPSFQEVPRSLMNPTEAEQKLYDHEAVKDLQWTGNDIEGAKKLLDDAGIVDTDGDGFRDLNGEKLSFNACCPNGWTDWMAAMEVVAAAGEKIGIEITTNFPDWSVYSTVYTNPDQTEYAIFMQGTHAAAPSQPWGRIRQLMGKDLVGKQNNNIGNYGQFVSDEADAVIQQIPLTTDEAELKQLYTEAVRIYLTEVPSFSLMYRPGRFFAVNESVWTNFPEAGDGRNIPPSCCTEGYGIAALYELQPVNP